MSFARFRILMLAVLWILIVGLFAMNVFGMICPSGLVAYAEGNPIVTVRESEFLCTGISQVVSDDENLYVLFGNYGVVQAYTLDGVYRYTISVYNHANGRTEIAVLKNRLYIEDKVSNLYVLEDGVLTEYFDRLESSEFRQRLPFGKWDSDYVIKSGSVWYAPNGVLSHCVIQRPAWLGLYQNDGITVLLLLLVALSGALLVFPNRKSSA